ncbi:MAG: ABC transporter permease, partial [Actinomycetota bacterium]|nr:ABC transporter permease [Actinomycetota bacterium]
MSLDEGNGHMTAEARTPGADGPPAALRYRRRLTLRHAVRELWSSRALVLTLAERDLRVRYKQAVLGFAWSILNPIVLLVAFTIIFEHAAHIDTGGAPYPLFSYLGLLPWTFFSGAVNTGSQSIVAEQSLLNKVYFPREAFPLGDIMVAAADTVMASLALVLLFLVEGFVPRATSYWVPVFIPIAVAFAVGVTLATSSMLVYLRDVRQALPIVMQLGLFATPVAYAFTVIPTNLQPVYAVVNPLGPVIDGLRQTVLYGHAPHPLPLIVAAVSS